MNPNTNHVKKSKQTAGQPEPAGSCFSKSICSSTDCTGLIPAMPSAAAELEAYEEMYQFCLDAASAHKSDTAKQS